MACYYLISNLDVLPLQNQQWMECLVLGAATVYILNCLFYTPDTGSCWRSVMEHMLMRIINMENEGYNSEDKMEDMPMLCVSLRQGLFFFGQIVEDHHMLRLSWHHLKDSGFKKLMAVLCSYYHVSHSINLRV